MPEPPGKTTSFRLLSEFLHIGALINLAIAQPIYDLLSQHPEFFIVRGNQALDVFIFALVLSLLLPLSVTTLLELVRRLSGHAFIVLKAAVFIVAVGCLSLLAAKAHISSGLICLSVSLVVAALVYLLYLRYPAARLFFSYLSASMIILPVIFLYQLDFGRVLTPTDQQTNSPEYTSATGERPDTPIVMIVFDELSLISLLDEKGQIDRIRYPNFTRLSHRSNWYRNATTVHVGTLYAVPAILSGRIPDKPRLPSSLDYPQSLFTRLSVSHRLNVWEPLTQLCPQTLCPRNRGPIRLRLKFLFKDLYAVYLHTLLPDEYRAGLPPVNYKWKNFDEDNGSGDAGTAVWEAATLMQRKQKWSKGDRLKIFNDFLLSINDQANFNFLHSMLPHRPWEYLPDGQRYIADGVPGLKNDVWLDSTRATAEARQRYLLQVGLVDKLIGDLIDRLEELGIYQRALLVITSDHGVAFVANSNRRRCQQHVACDNIARVPLFIKAPYQEEGLVSDLPVQSIDIVPAISDLLKVDKPWRSDGFSPYRPDYPRHNTRKLYDLERQSGVFKHRQLSRTIDINNSSLQRKLSIFGSGDVSQIFHALANRQLLYRQSDSLSIEPDERLAYHLENAAQYESVDPQGPVIPAQIIGELVTDRPPEAPVELAIAVNGIIQATTQTSVIGNLTQFRAMVSAGIFRAGRNEVEVYRVISAADSVALRKLQKTANQRD